MPLPEFPVQDVSSWQASAPSKRHKRRLSWTKVGRQGRHVSACADFSNVRATDADQLARLLKSGDLDQIYYYFLAASGVHGPGVLKCEPRSERDRAKLKKRSIELLSHKLEKLCAADPQQLRGSDLLLEIQESHTRSRCLGSPSSLKRLLERLRSLMLRAIEAGKIKAEDVGIELLELAAQDTLDRLERARRLVAERQKALEREALQREMERVAALHGLERPLEVHANPHVLEAHESEVMQHEERRQQLADLEAALQGAGLSALDTLDLALRRCRQKEPILRAPIHSQGPAAVELLLRAEDRLAELRLQRERLVAMLAQALQSEELPQLREALAECEAMHFTGVLVERVRIAIQDLEHFQAVARVVAAALETKDVEELDRAVEVCEELGGRGLRLLAQVKERRTAILLEMAEMDLQMAITRPISSPDWSSHLQDAISDARRHGVGKSLTAFAKGRLNFVLRRRAVTARLTASVSEVRSLQTQREAALRSRGRWEKRRPLDFDEFVNLSTSTWTSTSLSTPASMPTTAAAEKEKQERQEQKAEERQREAAAAAAAAGGVSCGLVGGEMAASSSSSAAAATTIHPRDALQIALQEARILTSEPTFCGEGCDRREELEEQEELETWVCLAAETLQAEVEHSKQIEAARGLQAAVSTSSSSDFGSLALHLEALKRALLEADARKLPKALLAKGDLALRSLLEKQTSLRSLRQFQISFEDAEDQPNVEGRQALHRIALVLLRFPEVPCSVHGHRRCRAQCRRIGCQDEDLDDKHAQLSSRRAWNVVQALRAKGCTNEFPTRGWGCQHPIIRNSRRLVRVLAPGYADDLTSQS